MSRSIVQKLTSITFLISEKIATLMFFSATPAWTAQCAVGRPNGRALITTYHFFFSCEAKISTTKTSCFVETEPSQTEHWLQYSETYARKFWTTIFLSVNLRFVFFFPQKKIIASDPSVFLLWSYRKKETDCKSELTTDEFSEEGDSIVQFGPTRIHH